MDHLETKKRPLDNEDEKAEKKAKLESIESPPIKKRTIKIIPPKSEGHQEKEAPFTLTVPTLPDHPEPSTSPRRSPTSPKKQLHSPGKADKEAEKKLQDKKQDPEFQLCEKTLSKMKLLRNPEQVLYEIIKKKTEKSNVIVNDARLLDSNHPNYDSYLGHVVYTGAQSRAAHSNRAIDLELFLFPVFTEKHHYATIQVRIPAEFLTYRGNIAVRKSALWGTDVYTDDSDVVAMIIHSGHYRPVDAPDPLTKSPDVPSVDQAALAAKATDSRSSSSIVFESEIDTKVQPVIAQADPVNSSANILTPDHDLHVTLRILPRLVKYTGSTRYGLDSKGWGSSHDGESVRVEKVEKVERGSVRKSVKKGFSKKWFESAQGVKDVDTSFSLLLDGTVSFKYTPKSMIAWPAYLKNQLNPSENEGASPNKSAEYLTSDLEAMKDLPYWRVQFSKYSLVLETTGGSKLFVKHSDNTGLSIIDENETTLHRDLKPETFDWIETGLKVRDVQIPVYRYYWIK